MRGFWVFLYFFIFSPFHLWAHNAFYGIPTEDIPVMAKDGAVTSIKHLIPTQDKPEPPEVILFGPGILETPEHFAPFTRPFYESNYEIFIGKVRLVGSLGQQMTGRSTDNGLDEVLLLDYPAQLRELRRLAHGRPVHLIGHSMGGMEILATLSDPDLREEFKDFFPQIKAITLMMTPYDLEDLHWVIKNLARGLLLPLEGMGILGKQSLGTHHVPFKVTRWLQDHPNAVLRWTGQKVEEGLVGVGSYLLNGLIFSRDFMSSKMNREFFPGLSRIPVTVMKDLGRAASLGQFIKRDPSLRGNGRLFFNPQSMPDIPIQLVIASNDILVSMASSRRLQNDLPRGPLNRVVVLQKATHVGPVVGDLVPSDFYTEVRAFHDSPFRAVREKGHEVHLLVHPNYCQVLMRLRH